MNDDLKNTLEDILIDKNNNLLPENLKAGVTCLGVEGTMESGTKLPEDIFVQSEVPTKTTTEAIWLKQSPADDTPFLDKLPDEILDKTVFYSDFTLRDAISKLTEEQKQEINNAKQHVIYFYDLQNIKIYFADENCKLYYRYTNDDGIQGTISFKQMAMYRTSSASLYTVNTDEVVKIGYNFGNTYSDTMIYESEASTNVKYPPNIEFTNRTEPGLNIVNDDTMTTVYMNKGTDFEKILDTSDGNITTSDVLEGKIGYANNQKIIGTYTPLNTSDATATSTDIANGKTAYVNNEKITGSLREIGPSDMDRQLLTCTRDTRYYVPNDDTSSITHYVSDTGNNCITAYGKLVKMGEIMSDDYWKRGIVDCTDENPSNNPEAVICMSNTKVAQQLGITPEKIVKGQSIIDIQGTAEIGVDTSDATAVADNIEEGKTAYVNGEKITGTIMPLGGGSTNLQIDGVSFEENNPNYGDIIVFQTTTSRKQIYVKNAKIKLSTNVSNIASVIGLTPEQIVSGNTVLGIEGTGGGGSSSDNTAKIDMTKTSSYANPQFYRFITEISNLDMTPVTNAQGLFSNSENLETISLKNCNNLTNVISMFQSCKNLKSITGLTLPLNITSVKQLFDWCGKLETINDFTISNNITDMSLMFEQCTSLLTLPLMDTSNVTNMASTFSNCKKITNIPQMDTSNVTNMSYTFFAMELITSFPELNTSSVTNMNSIFNCCYALITVPVLNTSNVTTMNGAFSYCYNLSNESLNNIMQMCINATSYTGTKTLKTIGLSAEQATKCQSLSNYQAFLDAGWTTGY